MDIYALGYNPVLLYLSGCSSMLLFKLAKQKKSSNLSYLKESVLNADKFSNMPSFFCAEPQPTSGPDTSMACASRGSRPKESRDSGFAG